MDDEEVLVNKDVSAVVADANGKAAEKTVGSDAVCDRDYDAPCPDGWSSVDSECTAPPSYDGGCSGASFASISDKSKFAENCDAPWPCKDACTSGHDYTGCPT